MSKSKAIKPDLNKSIHYAAWAAIALLGVIYIFRTNEILYYLGGDDAYYILLAKAIVAGEGYRDTFYVGSPADTHFPPMFPVILAGVIAIFGANSYIMKLVVSFGAAATLVLSYMLLRRRRFAWPFVAFVCLGCCYRFYNSSDYLLSETVFMALTLGTMLAFDIWLENGKIKFAALVVICCWMAELTRTAGITIPVAVGITIFVKKGRSGKAALQAFTGIALLMIPAVLWSIRNRISSEEKGSYFSQFLAVDPYDPTKGVLTLVGLLKRFLDGMKYYFIDVAGALRPFDKVEPTVFNILIASILCGLVLVGFVLKTKEDFGITEIFTFVFVGMAVIWPFLDYRFLLPAYPFIFAYAVHGAYFIVKSASGKKPERQKYLIGAFLAVFMVILGANSTRILKYNKFIKIIKYREVRIAPGMYVFSSKNDFDQLLRASLWLVANGEKNAVVMTRKPSLVALVGAKPVIGVPIPPPDDPLKWVIEHRIRYIIIDQIKRDSAQFMLALTNGQEEIEGAKIVYNSDHTFIFELSLELLKK